MDNRTGADQGAEINKFPALVKEWKEVLVLAVGAVTAVLTTLGLNVKGPWLLLGYAIAAALLGVGIYFYYRIRRKHELKRRREEAREAFKTKRQHRMAFRGLYPYQEGDTLPGQHRQREALTIFTQMTDPDFSFGVVCGDSGCGKTSLLRSALQSRLKEDGHQANYRVLYLSSPRELSAQSQQSLVSDSDDRAAKLRHELDTLKEMIARAGDGQPVVLVIDQFEEFFIEYRSELRTTIGTFLNALINNDPSTRILCAVRRDYLVDMRDLAPQLPEPISVKTLFVIKNLTIEQAANIIRECAKADNIELEDGFAHTLAIELAEGGEVRPPELQIVCTALAGNPTLAEYRLAGGARGILSHYIQNAIAICGDPKVGSQVLRALCDFPAHAKRNPQTLEALAEAIVPPAGMSQQQLLHLMGNILAQFETDRLVLIDTRGMELTYMLVHDYLVDAVAAATSDISTRVEEANHLLQYYLSQSHTDNKIRIPFRRTRFIQKYADPAALKEPRARSLLRASRNSYLMNIASVLGVILILTGVLVAVLNTNRVWEATEAGRHFARGETGSASIQALPDGVHVVTRSYSGTSYVRLWESKTGKLLRTYNGYGGLQGSSDFMLMQAEDRHQLNIVRLLSGEVYETPIPYASDKFYDFGNTSISQSGLILAYITGRTTTESGDEEIESGGTLKVWSVMDRSYLGEIEACTVGSTGRVYLTNSGDRIIMDCRRGQMDVPTLWNVRTGEMITYLAPNESPTNDFDVDEERGRIATIHSLESGQTLVRLWDLQTGQYREQEVKDVPNNDSAPNIYFSKDGEFLVLIESALSVRSSVLRVLNTSNLLSAADGPKAEAKKISSQDPEEIYIAWTKPDGTYVWQVNRNSKPKMIKDLTLGVTDIRVDGIVNRKFLYVDQKGDRLAFLGGGNVQLFDLSSGTKLKDLETNGRVKSLSFTIDGSAIALALEGGLIEIYSLSDGELIAELSNVGGDSFRIFYDSNCQRTHVWTEDGRVLRYTKGRKILGKWFWPQTRCGD